MLTEKTRAAALTTAPNHLNLKNQYKRKLPRRSRKKLKARLIRQAADLLFVIQALDPDRQKVYWPTLENMLRRYVAIRPEGAL